MSITKAKDIGFISASQFKSSDSKSFSSLMLPQVTILKPLLKVELSLYNDSKCVFFFCFFLMDKHSREYIN